jgi:hypothetical protein
VIDAGDLVWGDHHAVGHDNPRKTSSGYPRSTVCSPAMKTTCKTMLVMAIGGRAWINGASV